MGPNNHETKGEYFGPLNRAGRRAEKSMVRKAMKKRGPNFTKPKRRR